MSEFYAYLWLRTDGTPYYVGKGCDDRAFVQENHYCPVPSDRSHILILDRATEQEAFTAETELIHNWGRKDAGTGILRNLTDGGDGSSGYRHTEDALQKMSAAHKGRHLSPATEFTAASWLGKKRPPFSDDHRRRISESKKGSRGFTGRHTAETKD